MAQFNIGKYEVTDTLGSGAMGVVYKAFDPGIARNVAIKILHEQHRQGKQGEELEVRFKQEAQAAARCLHVNIVAIFEYGIGKQGAPYIVMEYVQGVELKRYLQGEQGDLSIGQSIEIISQVLKALDYAHQHGVIHRDIKPSNIIITDQNRVKVMDFGVAKLDTSDLTLAGYMIGTPSYMSPEGLRGQIADARSDLYATALVLLELLTGSKIKVGENIVQRVNELIGEQVPPHPIRDALSAMLIKALQPEPDDRFQKAQDFLDALLLAMQAGTNTSEEERTAYAGTVVVQQSITTQQAPQTRSSTPVSTQSRARRARADSTGTRLGTTSITLTPAVVSDIEKNLATHIGPLAKVLVKRGMRSADSLEHFTQSLADHIPNPSERNTFMKRLKSSGIEKVIEASQPGMAKTTGTASKAGYTFTPASLKNFSDQLAFYLGPMAPRLVKGLARQSASPRELQEKLAQKIPCAKERQAFLDLDLA